MDADKARELVPAETQSLFDDIRYSRVLGANTHIEMIGKMIVSIANHEKEASAIIAKASALTTYFKETRGNQSRAVYNALQEMSVPAKKLEGLSVEQVRKMICDAISLYAEKAKKDGKIVTQYACNLCEGLNTIMVYDYSSTVNSLLLHLSPARTVYIPESRALGGGFPFVKASLQAGHTTHFIPDANMMEALSRCQAVFIGVESFYPNGTVFNTIGSDILSLLCKHLDIPFYALTPMVKLDMRNLQGIAKLSPMPYDFSVKIAKDWDEDLRSKVDFKGVKLVGIKPEYITGIVTEFGVIPPGAMLHTALSYSEKWRNLTNE